MVSCYLATFTDHMAVATFDPSTGWSDPEIKPYAPLALDPASSCFQYCSNIFEGMKAYLGPDGKARLFRPELNMRRFERSAARLALPPIDGDGCLELIKRLVHTEKRWIPSLQGYSLYIRPTVIGTRPALGVTASDHAMLYVIASPCGPYFPQGLRPVSLLAISDKVRAWPGGTGGHKVGGNYSPGFLPQRVAAKQGYDQVLWLFGEEKRVTEAGAMNFFVVLTRDDGDGYDLITAPLDGTILPGVTRASCLALGSDPAFNEATGLNLHPTERPYTMQDLVEWSSQGKLAEALCIGTAAIVAAVNKIGYEGKDISVREYEVGLGPVGMALREKILAIQEGREEYEGWSVVCE
ncbi:branched-chain amino acid aminotransferase II [Gyrodon lividus]|nr:branched-chain amino acid aminotransferase II [Gyrodon lividus]